MQFDSEQSVQNVPTRRAVIVGAGIAGLAVALRLRQIGWEPIVVEKAPERRDSGYVVTLFGLGYHAAERRGVLQAMRARHVEPFEFRYVKPDGRHRFSVPSAAVHDLLGDRSLVLLRGDVEDVLYQAVHDAVDIRFGTTVESVTQDREGVRAVLSDGSTVDAELLVGADGLHSTVRRLVFGPEHQFRHGLNHMVTACVLDGRPDRVPAGTATMLATVGRTVTVISLGPDRAAAFLIHATPDPAADLAAGPVRAVGEYFGDLGWLVPDIQARLREPASVYFDSVSQIVTDRWGRGRVVLLGDAAWCVSLFGGYGSSFALAGADLLATTLDHHPEDIPAALNTWESHLRPTVEQRQRLGRRNTTAHAPATRFHLIARDVSMRLVALAPVRRLIRHRLDLHG
ncbi:FAD-dependent monooxygenase [Actinophytocola sp.]|uniref:FAD-dependent monooxygenase n=1 Tax=Actinophytocola sp. TaxID=1872138 RepID=UPI002ED537E4